MENERDEPEIEQDRNKIREVASIPTLRPTHLHDAGGVAGDDDGGGDPVQGPPLGAGRGRGRVPLHRTPGGRGRPVQDTPSSQPSRLEFTKSKLFRNLNYNKLVIS